MAILSPNLLTGGHVYMLLDNPTAAGDFSNRPL